MTKSIEIRPRRTEYPQILDQELDWDHSNLTIQLFQALRLHYCLRKVATKILYRGFQIQVLKEENGGITAIRLVNDCRCESPVASACSLVQSTA